MVAVVQPFAGSSEMRPDLARIDGRAFRWASLPVGEPSGGASAPICAQCGFSA